MFYRCGPPGAAGNELKRLERISSPRTPVIVCLSDARGTVGLVWGALRVEVLGVLA